MTGQGAQLVRAPVPLTWSQRRPARWLRSVLQDGPLRVAVGTRLALEAHGVHELPDPDEPTLIVANHGASADPALVLAVLPRPWRRRTAVLLPVPTDELSRSRALTQALALNSVRLPADVEAEASGPEPGLGAAAEALLRAGWHVLCFPEGERSRDGFLAPFRPATAAVALRLGRPVLPVGLRGSYAALPGPGLLPLPGRPRVSVRFGGALRGRPGEAAPDFAARWHEAVRRLIAEDALSWWIVQGEGDGTLAPPAASWRRIWEQTEAPAAGGRPKRPKIWRS